MGEQIINTLITNKTSNLIYAEGGSALAKLLKAAWHILTWVGALISAWATAITVIVDDGGQVPLISADDNGNTVTTMTSLQSVYGFTDRAVTAAVFITIAVLGVLAIGATAKSPTSMPFANGLVGSVLSIGFVLELSLFDQAVAYGSANDLWKWALSACCLIAMGVAQISANSFYLSHENFTKLVQPDAEEAA